MPLTSAAKKANSRSIVLRERNYSVKTTMKATLKKVKKIANSEQLLDTHVQDAYSKVDKALKVGILHKNTAARRKSQIAKLMNKSA